MKILIVAPTPFFADRGCHVRILGEAKALVKLGHEVLICTYHLGNEVKNIATARSVSIPWYRKLSPGPSFHKFYIDFLLLITVLRSTFRFKPDIIHAHLHEGVVLGWITRSLFRLPMVADLQGSLTEELRDHDFLPERAWIIRLFYWIERRINRLPDHLIASSTQTRQLCIDRFDVEKRRISAFPDGVDVEVFYPREDIDDLRRSLQLEKHHKLVVFIGVLTEYQGIGLLIEAVPRVIARVPDARFLVIGYPNEEHYRRRAEELGVGEYMRFTGKVAYDRAPSYLSLGRVAISPKISATEANLKLFVYMAMALPSVVFENEINREILQDLGVYAENESVESLAESVIYLLQNPEKASALGRKSREKALEKYSWLATGQKLIELYEQEIERRSPNL